MHVLPVQNPHRDHKLLKVKAKSRRASVWSECSGREGNPMFWAPSTWHVAHPLLQPPYHNIVKQILLTLFNRGKLRYGMKEQNHQPGWAPVAHACNPSYSGARDLEDHSLKPVWANSSRDPISKKITIKKRVDGLVYETLSSNPSTSNRKKTTWS
jgi:hypothetical protein